MRLAWKEYDLSETKDSSLIGAIGEILAWKYLMRNRILIHKIGGLPPFSAVYPSRRGELNYEIRGLSAEQIEFLKEMCSSGPVRFDFVGIRRKWSWKKGDYVLTPYLIEVKTTGPRGERKDLAGLVKGKIPQRVEEAKDVGFKVLLVIVNLFSNWKYAITSLEL